MPINPLTWLLPWGRTSAPGTKRWTRTIIRGTLLGLTVFLLYQVWFIFLAGNVRESIPNLVYRCSQPDGDDLEKLIGKYGIKTVINLRGCCDPYPWYLEEARACHQNNIALEDLTFSAGHLPSVHEIRHLVEVLEGTQFPVLVHCFRGVDRTGLATTVAKLLLTSSTIREARKELSILKGHIAMGHTRHMTRFFDLYEEWLQDRNQLHSPERFRHWIMHEYAPDACVAKIELLTPIHGSWKIPVGKPAGLKVRVTNVSPRQWNFTTTDSAGFHLYWDLYDEDEIELMAGRSGLLKKTIQPGESIDLTVVLPPQKPGSYLLQIDMVEEQHCYFRQVGGEPLDVKVHVE